MTQQGAKRRYNFGTNCPEVAGLGCNSNKQFYSFDRKAKSIKYASVLTLALLAV